MNNASEQFNSLYDQYRNRVYCASLRYLKNEPDAEDIVQVVMTSAWRQLQTGKGINSPKAWFAETTKNACLNVLRSSHLDTSLDEIIQDHPESEPAENPYDEPAISPELRHALRTAVDNLPAKTREVMTAFYFAAKTIPVIAKEMNRSANTIKWHLNAGRDALRSLFTCSRSEAA